MKKKYLFCPECSRSNSFGEQKEIYCDNPLESYVKGNPWALDKSAILCNFCGCTIPLGLAERNGITNDGQPRLIGFDEAVEIWNDQYVPYGPKRLW